MCSTSRSAGGSMIGAWLFVTVAVATAPIFDLNSVQDGLTDTVISPACRIGSLQSWQGRPCVISER
jgi:hypothetical protein